MSASLVEIVNVKPLNFAYLFALDDWNAVRQEKQNIYIVS